MRKELFQKIESQVYCVTKEQVLELQQFDEFRLLPVLVRCGCGRFSCPLQDVEHFIEIIERDWKVNHENQSVNPDYIRDVSLMMDYWKKVWA